MYFISTPVEFFGAPIVIRGIETDAAYFQMSTDSLGGMAVTTYDGNATTVPNAFVFSADGSFKPQTIKINNPSTTDMATFGITPSIAVKGNIGLQNNANSSAASSLVFFKDRSSGTVVNGDTLGSLSWAGKGTTLYVQGPSLQGYVDGVPAANVVPTALRIATNGSTLMYFRAAGRIHVGANTDDGSSLFQAYGIIAARFGTQGDTLRLRGGSAAVAGNGARINFGTHTGALDTVGGAAIQSALVTGGETNGQSAHLDFYTNRRTGVNTYSGLTTRYRITDTGNHLFGSTTDDAANLVQIYGNTRLNNGKMTIDGASLDTRLLFHGGGGSPTKALSINFSNAGDSQGNFSIQRRTTADVFEAVMFGINLTNSQVYIGNNPAGAVTGNVLTVLGQACIVVANPDFRLTGTRNWGLRSVDADGRFSVTDWTSSIERFTISTAGLAEIVGEMRAKLHTSTLINRGVITTTIALDWTAGEGQMFTQTTLTNHTVTFSANPAAPCYVTIKINAPAAGTTPTITAWPATIKGTMPTTVTLAKSTVVSLWWDGTNYWVMGTQPNL